MIWWLIFLSIPSSGIAAGKYAHLWGFTYMEVPAYAFENDIVKINCSQNISINKAQFLTMKSGSSPITKVTTSVDKARPAMWNKDFTVMPGSNGTYIYTKVKAQCKHTNIYFCVNEKIITAFFNNHRLHVIKKVSKPKMLYNKSCSTNATCAKCTDFLTKVNVTCKTKVSFPKDAQITFAWYFKYEWDESWTRIINNGSSVLASETAFKYTSKNCPPLKEKTSVLNVNTLLRNEDIELKCEVTFILGNLHQKSSAVQKFCSVSSRHYMEGMTQIHIFYENETFTLTCVNEEAHKKKDFAIVRPSNDLSYKNHIKGKTQTIGKVTYQGSNRSLPHRFEFYGFKAIQDNSTKRLTLQKIAQCTDTNYYACALDGTLSGTIPVTVMKYPTLQMFVPNDICAEGNLKFKNACHACEHVIMAKNNVITVHCQTNLSDVYDSYYSLGLYYKEKGLNNSWTFLYLRTGSTSWIRDKFKECSQRTINSKTFISPNSSELTVKCNLEYGFSPHRKRKPYRQQATADICIKRDSDNSDPGDSDSGDLGAIPRWRKLDTKIILGMASITLLVWVAVFILFYLIRTRPPENRESESDSDGKLGQNNKYEGEQMTSELSLNRSHQSVGLKKSLSDQKRSQTTIKHPHN